MSSGEGSSRRATRKRAKNSNIDFRDFKIEKNVDFRSLAGKDETAFALSIFKEPEVYPFVTLPDIFYPRLVREFYKTLSFTGTNDGLFTFNILGWNGSFSMAIFADVFGIPRDEDDVKIYPSDQDMVNTLSVQRHATRQTLRRSHLASEMWLVDCVFANNIFPSGHHQERRGYFLKALYSVSQQEFIDTPTIIPATMLHIANDRTSTPGLLGYPRLISQLILALGYQVQPNEEVQSDFPKYGFTEWKRNLDANRKLAGLPNQDNEEPVDDRPEVQEPWTFSREHYELLLKSQNDLRDSQNNLRDEQIRLGNTQQDIYRSMNQLEQTQNVHFNYFDAWVGHQSSEEERQRFRNEAYRQQGRPFPPPDQ